MRGRVAILALAACTESAEERLDSFLAKTEIVCGTVSGPCAGEPTRVGDVPPERMVACMNDALASGARALVSWSEEDPYLFFVTTYLFTVDHQVKEFYSYPDGDRFSEPGTISEVPSCAGTFRLDDQGCLAWDGCP